MRKSRSWKSSGLWYAALFFVLKKHKAINLLQLNSFFHAAAAFSIHCSEGLMGRYNTYYIYKHQVIMWTNYKRTIMQIYILILREEGNFIVGGAGG